MEFRWEPSCVDRTYRLEPRGIYRVNICPYEPDGWGDIDGSDIDRCHRTTMVGQSICQICPLADTHLKEVVVSHQPTFESGRNW